MTIKSHSSLQKQSQGELESLRLQLADERKRRVQLEEMLQTLKEVLRENNRPQVMCIYVLIVPSAHTSFRCPRILPHHCGRCHHTRTIYPLTAVQ